MCQNNPEKSYTEKKKLSMCLLVTHGLHAVHLIHQKTNKVITEDMEMFSKNLKNQVMKITNYEKKKIIPSTNDENKSYEKQKIFDICKKEFCTNKNNENEFKLNHKVRDHCHYTGKF